MNMNVNPVGFGAKMPVSRIKIVENLKRNENEFAGNYLTELLQMKDKTTNIPFKDMISKIAELYKTTVTLFQTNPNFEKEFGDNFLLMNAGPITSKINLSQLKEKGEEVIDAIINNIKANGEVTAGKGVDKVKKTFLE